MECKADGMPRTQEYPRQVDTFPESAALKMPHYQPICKVPPDMTTQETQNPNQLGWDF